MGVTNKMSWWNSVLIFVFILEAYHSASHWMVLSGWKMLPRKDLVSVRYYFLIDCASAAIGFSLHRNEIMLPFLILQQWQHIFYFSTWDVSNACKRVVSWSSLDWNRGRWNQLDLVAGTVFDLAIHVANAWLIGLNLSLMNIALSLVVVAIGVFVIFYNPKFAWASRDSAPEWVQKRIRPLSEDQVQEVQFFDKLTQ